MRTKHIYVFAVEDDLECWSHKYAKKRKLVRIGSGAFAHAYSTSKKKGKIVTKIGICEVHHKKDPYLTYLREIVLKQQGNPIVPKVYGVTIVHIKYRDDWTDRVIKGYCYIVKMERLEPFKKISRNVARKELWRHGLSEIDDLDNPVQSAQTDLTGNLAKIAKRLHKLMDRHAPDIHNGNVMWRTRKGKRPQFVITDPVA